MQTKLILAEQVAQFTEAARLAEAAAAEAERVRMIEEEEARLAEEERQKAEKIRLKKEAKRK